MSSVRGMWPNALRLRPNAFLIRFIRYSSHLLISCISNYIKSVAVVSVSKRRTRTGTGSSTCPVVQLYVVCCKCISIFNVFFLIWKLAESRYRNNLKVLVYCGRSFLMTVVLLSYKKYIFHSNFVSLLTVLCLGNSSRDSGRSRSEGKPEWQR